MAHERSASGAGRRDDIDVHTQRVECAARLDVDPGLEVDRGERAEISADFQQRQTLSVELNVEQSILRPAVVDRRHEARAIGLDGDVAGVNRSAIESQIPNQTAQCRLTGIRRHPIYRDRDAGLFVGEADLRVQTCEVFDEAAAVVYGHVAVAITIDCIVIGGAPGPPVLRRVLTNRLKFHPASSRRKRMMGLSSVIESRMTPSEIIVSGLYSTGSLSIATAVCPSWRSVTPSSATPVKMLPLRRVIVSSPFGYSRPGRPLSGAASS